jgi:hypothetical protein
MAPQTENEEHETSFSVWAWKIKSSQTEQIPYL